MPIYEYRCDACDHQFEKIQKMSDDPLKDCPECTQPQLVKLISASGFQLKGTGWYETDFKNKSSQKNSTNSQKSGDSAASGSCASGSCGHKH